MAAVLQIQRAGLDPTGSALLAISCHGNLRSVPFRRGSGHLAACKNTDGAPDRPKQVAKVRVEANEHIGEHFALAQIRPGHPALV
jgi:hypothetical protein